MRATGFSSNDSERHAAEEFGDAQELSFELAKGYPPKTAANPRRLRFLPEIAMTVMLSIAAYSFSIYGGHRGIEAAAGILLPALPILMVPGVTAGLGRLKYRRLRPLATLIRLSNYCLCVCLIATACLVTLQIEGRATLTSVFPIYYAFAAATALMYWVMRTTFSDGKVYTYFRHRLRIHLDGSA